jgi:hypothetical protein
MLTFTAIAAASYSYLVGAALIGVGSTRLGILGYLVGLIFGMSFVSLAGGSLSFRYGVDPVDASKASLGMRGSILLLVGVLVCTLGWANVLLAMTAEAAVHIVHIKGFNSGAPLNVKVTLTGFALIIAIWLLVRRGAVGMERVANACAALQIIIAGILLSTILFKYGAVKVWMTDIPPAQAYSPDRMTQLTYAVEFGLCNSLGMLPYMGGLARLVGNSRHLVGPAVCGYGIFGAFFIAAIGALANRRDRSVSLDTHHRGIGAGEGAAGSHAHCQFGRVGNSSLLGRDLDSANPHVRPPALVPGGGSRACAQHDSDLQYAMGHRPRHELARL